MDSNKKRKLEKTISTLQDRWGVRAVRRLQQDDRSPFPILPTGFEAIDEILMIGGLPRGRISEIIGVPTSGMVTMALKIVAHAQEQAKAQKQSIVAIYIDPEHTFDPDYAASCGLALNHLILVQPIDLGQALAILKDFVLSGGVTLIIFDAPVNLLTKTQPAQTLASTLDQLIAPLSQTNCILFFLTSLPIGTPPISFDEVTSLDHYPTTGALPHYAAVRLYIQHERWIYKQRDIRGYQSRVLVVKNKMGPAGKNASIFLGEP